MKKDCSMKERPILFCAPMVRALLDGSKTQTRRAMKTQPVLNGNFWQVYGASWSQKVKSIPAIFGHSLANNCPYGQPGDRLWVRETWDFLPSGTSECMIRYFADNAMEQRTTPANFNPFIYGHEKKRPSIHLPRWASRILLEIVSVRVERLQNISESDALAEGVKSCEAELDTSGNWYAPEELYSMLWTKINGWGDSGWNANPWVWVVEFRRIEP